MSQDPLQTKTRNQPAPPAIIWLAVVFAVVAAAFAVDLWGHVPPPVENEPIDGRFLEHATVRDPLLAPKLRKKHFTYLCNECHQNFDSTAGGLELVAEHTDIVLDHGANSNCRNCHNPDNWETLRDYEGVVSSFAKSEKLCSKCHGPKYRDWVGGAHGRPNGHWDLARGVATRTTCVECHDPHSPRFKPLEPAPAPKDQRATTEEPHHG